jgi:hypothetical protein
VVRQRRVMAAPPSSVAAGPVLAVHNALQGGLEVVFELEFLISSVDVMQNCEGSLSRDKFLF